MRINDRFTPSTEFIPESRHFLSEIIDQIKTNPTPQTSRKPTDEPDPKMKEFFEEFYIPLGSGFELPLDCQITDRSISSYENRIINYCKAPNSPTRILVFHGHTGVGKSTLLKRILFYFYPHCPSFRSYFFPIYIPMAPNLITKDSEEAFMKIANEVCRFCYEVIKEEVINDAENIFSNINERGRWSYSRITNSDIKKAKTNLESWLSAFVKDDKSRIEFFLDVVENLILKKKFNPIVFLDDVDAFDNDIHSNTFLALDSLANYGINSIVSMRTSTFESHSAGFLQYQDQRIELKLSPELIWQIMYRRVKNLGRLIALHPNIAYRITKFEEVKGSDVIDAFTKLITQKDCMEALINLSNTNIRSVFSKLELMSKSEAFSDTFVVHQLLESELIGPRNIQQSKMWIFYNLLLGNFSGTYRRDPEAQKAGLINFFDSNVITLNPWRHFIKICILMHLYKNWRLSRNEDKYIDCSAIHENIKSAFGTSLRNSLFIDALFTLVQSELVFTGSCRKYTSKTPEETILSDSVRISMAGLFYLENLLHKVEYLYFIKDDINWNLQELPEQLTPAGRDYSRKVKFTSVLEALRLLLTIEYDCLRLLKNAWTEKPNYHDALSRYRDQFSPFGLPETTSLIFCKQIFRNYTKYMKRIMGDTFKNSDVELKMNEIDTMIKDNQSLEQDFIRASS